MLSGLGLVRADGPSERTVAITNPLEEAASVVRAHRANPHAAGLILANPIPTDSALPQALIDEAIAEAQAEAEADEPEENAVEEG